jgi:hypothetical protein
MYVCITNLSPQECSKFMPCSGMLEVPTLSSEWLGKHIRYMYAILNFDYSCKVVLIHQHTGPQSFSGRATPNQAFLMPDRPLGPAMTLSQEKKVNLYARMKLMQTSNSMAVHL